MTQISSDELKDIAERLFVPRVVSDLGIDWSTHLQRLLAFIQHTHRAVSTERLRKGMAIGFVSDPDARLLPVSGKILTKASQLTSFYDGKSPLTIQLLEDGRLAVWHEELDSLPDGESFLLYCYRGPHNEVIVTPTREHSVPQLNAAPSYFAVPYFLELEDALIDYGQNVARRSDCEIFSKVWHDSSRYIFRARPEIEMRRSLQSYLRHTLRNHSEVNVMPEQNVNETRPVDLKVIWGDANRTALVEIKWLGASASTDGTRFTQKFSASRAREGITQLVEYLDLYDRESGHEETRGYLVVYDGRRRRLKPTTSRLSREDAFYYRNLEIQFQPEMLDRPDLAPPVRMFCEPEA